MIFKTYRNTRRSQRGVGLIEVLVAILVLAVGVLGAAALQMNALKFNQTASVRSQATFFAYEIIDRMRANRDVARNGGYSIALTDGVPAAGGLIAQQDHRAWLTAIALQLPEGHAAIANLNDRFTVTIQWNELRVGGNAQQQFIFETEL